MIFAEKLSQKLNNLKSKNEIKDFFIFLDEFRSIKITNCNGKTSDIECPTQYSENSEGSFVIVWDNEFISTGNLNLASINDFEEFINIAQSTKVKHDSEIFIPARGIYPVVLTYSKSLADMIDIPEYLLKLSDITGELDKMIGASFADSTIFVRDGTRYMYSSRQLDEYYPYTRLQVDKSIEDRFCWKIRSSDTISIAKFHEVFSFYGDTFNAISKSEKLSLSASNAFDLILSPDIFEQLFSDQIISNIDGKNIASGTSCFKAQDFAQRLKCLNTLSLSYDPLLSHTTGTYRFTTFGLKPIKQYFIKYGKLDTPILDFMNFSTLGYKQPTVEIVDFANIKLEGLKERSFQDLKTASASNPIVFSVNYNNYKRINQITSFLHFEYPLYFKGKKNFVVDDFNLNVNLIKLINENRLELVRFVDGRLGCKISGIKISK